MQEPWLSHTIASTGPAAAKLTLRSATPTSDAAVRLRVRVAGGADHTRGGPASSMRRAAVARDNASAAAVLPTGRSPTAAAQLRQHGATGRSVPGTVLVTYLRAAPLDRSTAPGAGDASPGISAVQQRSTAPVDEAQPQALGPDRRRALSARLSLANTLPTHPPRLPVCVLHVRRSAAVPAEAAGNSSRMCTFKISCCNSHAAARLASS